VDPRRREQLTRYGAPAAFLAAVTIAAILVKAGLNGSSSTTVAITSSSTAARTTTAATTTTKLVLTAPPGSTTTATTETPTPGAEYYVVVSGDTLGSIAQKYNTTVDELTTLNPGIDPTALTVGQKIRIK
jgi:N-acetylmuramoyl-L-alanine amidase